MILLLFQILLDSSGDAFRVKKWQKLQHICEALQIVIWFVLAWFLVNVQFHDWQYLGIFYVCLRFVLFDLIYNLWTGNELTYIGDPENSMYATLLNWIFKGNLQAGVMTLKGIALFLLICEIINLWEVI